MEGFIQTISSYPALPLTVGVGSALGYWLLFLATGGVLDAGLTEGLTGGVKAAGDAVAGGVKAAGDAVTGSLKAATQAGSDALPSAGVLSLFGIGKVPVTITASVHVFLSWVLCTTSMSALGPGQDSLLVKTPVLLGSLALGFLATAGALRPLGRALDQARPTSAHELRGKVCVITSGHVDGQFGTATLEDRGAGLLLNVVCGKANSLARGHRALIVDLNPTTGVYEVEPVDWATPEELERLSSAQRQSLPS